jgi:hypothetical protein
VLANKKIPPVVNNNVIDDNGDDVIVFADGEVPPVFKVINGKTYRLRKKAEVIYESEDEDENKIKKEEEYVNPREGENEGESEGEDENEDEGEGSGDGETDDETDDEVNVIKRYKKKKVEDRKYKRFNTIDLNSRKGRMSLNTLRGRDEKSMRVLKYFGKEYDKDKYLNHGNIVGH